jgi:DNA invertase Pin-like site-specific DNA recombinase
MNERYDIYARLSQTGRDKSIDTQIEDCLAYAREQDLPVGEVHNEGEKASGFKPDDRPEYQTLRELIRAGELSGVIIRDDKRLTRDQVDLYRLFADMIENGVELHVAREGEIDLSDISGAVKLFTTTVSNKEKEKEMDEALRAIEEKRANGMPHGRPLRGTKYNADKTALVPDKRGEWDAVWRVVELHESDDDYSQRDLVDETGIPLGAVNRILKKRDRYHEVAERDADT